jgi:DNA-binding NarL/FixJ family response regulator
MQVILADNQAIYRAGIARVLAGEVATEVVAECARLSELVEAVERLRCSVVLFPSSFAWETHLLLDRIEGAGSLAVMILEEDAELDEALGARLHGVLMRSVAGRQLIECLYTVASGKRYTRYVMGKPRAVADPVGVKASQRLTARELQIVALICQGLKNKQIARQMGTKEQVVKNYLRNIYAKLRVSDRLELALFVVHHRALAEVVESTRVAMVRVAEESEEKGMEELGAPFGDGLGLGEEGEVVGAAGLGVGAAHIEAAEGMRSDHGAGALAIEVEIADVEVGFRAVELLAG